MVWPQRGPAHGHNPTERLEPTQTLTSARLVPLWPQLEQILRPFVFSRPPTTLLFPSFVTERDAMLTDWRKTLDRVAERAEWRQGETRTKAFRHAYCAGRLQTVESGSPVSPSTVSRELGHGSRAMVEEVYAHLGTMRHQLDAVEYRIEQHAEAFAERLAKLAFYCDHRVPRRGPGKTPQPRSGDGVRCYAIGAPGFEPGTSCSQSRRATGLRHTPLFCDNNLDRSPGADKPSLYVSLDVCLWLYAFRTSRSSAPPITTDNIVASSACR